MFLELIATFVAAVGAVGIVLLINRLTGGRLPKWAMPVAAGLTMIAMTIWMEYSWAARTTAELPEGMTVVEEVEGKGGWRPWTYFAPQVTRLIALDVSGIQTNPDAPDIRLVDLYLFARWRAPARVPQLVDCINLVRADVSDAALADPGAATWIETEPSDPLIARSCNPDG